MIDFLTRVWSWISSPFESQEALIAAVSGAWSAVAATTSKTGWPYLLSGIVIALIVLGLRSRGIRGEDAQRSLFGRLFPREVFLHKSARLDYKFVLLDLTVKGLLYAPLVAGVGWVAHKGVLAIGGALRGWIPWVAGLHVEPAWLAVALFLLGDFCFFFAHFLMHKVPMLWSFHEVHHSAEVLTPVTVYRTHPVEDLINAVVVGVVFGAVNWALALEPGDVADLPTMLGLNAVVFLFFLLGFQLRHSHVWLSYGPWLSRVLVSPAQHQLHHSAEVRHWDRNYGFIFAIWDGVFGSLYVPRERETFKLGLAKANPEDFDSVGKLYFLPFAKAWRHLAAPLAARGRARTQGSDLG